MNVYEKDCAHGRRQAAKAIADARATGDLPNLIRKIRKMAATNDGISVGFLFMLAEMAQPRG